ncbi:integrin alpha-V-like [Etheostoma spectabile]|uniref:integrin alpha-V-like n=1 Tax=Etheostoma spectabile TaxID=54343 RepID=UPI0013AF6DD0|nr:integrin alpha-V-like [Etheostoma spectabile]
MVGGRTGLGLVVLLGLGLQRCGSFNLDAEKPSVFSGPERSYFGFSVDFFKTSNNLNSDVLVGAPRANASSTGSVVERGAVYSCPWKTSSACQKLEFDTTGTKNWTRMRSQSCF